jgi:predicted dehydrogenase
MHSLKTYDSRDELIHDCDALIVTSENAKHLENIEAAAAAGKHILCEKPIAISEEQGRAILRAASGVKLMTAFPCRFSPAYVRLKERVSAGDIGKVLAVCATNHGICPFDWFVQSELSGGGAMMDHTVHVADLLRDLLQEEPHTVYAQTNSRLYGEAWDDSALLHLHYASGIFATIDASWSRPKTYKTWGDVKMNVVGDKGTLELDMFAQAFDHYTARGHGLAGYGSDCDARMVNAFVNSIIDDTAPPVSGEDGMAAARIAFAGYDSASKNEPVAS